MTNDELHASLQERWGEGLEEAQRQLRDVPSLCASWVLINLEELEAVVSIAGRLWLVDYNLEGESFIWEACPWVSGQGIYRAKTLSDLITLVEQS